MLVQLVLWLVACKSPVPTEVETVLDADGDGRVTSEDCDDTDPDVGGAEVPYDGIDNDCDSTTPDDDLDGDGHRLATDCDDTDARRHPDRDETCNGVDDDCDGLIDDDDAGLDAPRYFDDLDGDGYGDPSTATRACRAPEGTVSRSGDCNDADFAIHPDANEVCDGVDNDCNGSVDDADAGLIADTWYADADGDGRGNPNQAVVRCQAPVGYVVPNDDCDDADADSAIWSGDLQIPMDLAPADFCSCYRTTVDGAFEVRDWQATLTDLNGLACLREVRGDLEIYSESLLSLDGLEGLERVDGDFSINNTGVLNDTSALASLERIGGDLEFRFNDGLQQIDGLTALRTIGGTFRMYDQVAGFEDLASLTDVGGDLLFGSPFYGEGFLLDELPFSALTTVGGALDVGNSGTLRSFDGLSSLQTVGGDVEFSSLDGVTDLDGLSGLTSVGGSVRLGFMDALQGLDGFSGLTVVPGDLDLNTLYGLTDLDGLENVTHIGGNLETDSVNSLTTLYGLHNLESIGGDLSLKGIFYVPSLLTLSSLTSIGGGLQVTDSLDLVDLQGLEGLTSLGGDLDLGGDYGFTHFVDFTGLDNLESVAGNVDIWMVNGCNCDLQSVDGLESLTTIGGRLRIDRNINLTNLQGLMNVDTVGGDLQIRDNDDLPTSEAHALRDAIGILDIGGVVDIDGNGL